MTSLLPVGRPPTDRPQSPAEIEQIRLPGPVARGVLLPMVLVLATYYEVLNGPTNAAWLDRPDDRPPAEIIDIFALSVVGMLERVIVEKQGDRLDVPIDDLIDYCADFAAASLPAVYKGQISKRPTD
ncbi:hypothetical protein [Nocardia sp. NPDC004604]|uniref:hypothetical protein n=1 Tax=Nocardia sp. NPDC004604 TaxID=3157013 RepID=UPI0033A326DF